MQKNCKKGIHIKHKYSQKYNSSTINAEHCPLCDEFLKITKTCKNGALKNVSVKSFLDIYNGFGTYATPGPGYVNHLFRGPFKSYNKTHDDLKVIVSEFKEMLNETNDTNEKECIKQIVKLGKKLDMVETKLEDVEALIKKMCDNFGHNISRVGDRYHTYCNCCGRDMDYYYAKEHYKKAPLHGTVKFDYIEFGFDDPADDEEFDDDEDSDDDF